MVKAGNIRIMGCYFLFPGLFVFVNRSWAPDSLGIDQKLVRAQTALNQSRGHCRRKKGVVQAQENIQAEEITRAKSVWGNRPCEG